MPLDDLEAPLAPWLGFDHMATGYDGTETGTRRSADVVPLFELIDGFEALTRRYDEDAHAPGYVLRPVEGRTAPAVRQQPRVNYPSLGALAALGLMPVMSWIFVDIDNPGHTPWASPEAARAAAIALFDRPHPILDTAGVYTTRAGLRLVWRLPEPTATTPSIPVLKYRSWAEQFHAALTKATGIPVVRPAKRTDHPTPQPGGIDATCADWSRCYRLPNVIRRFRAKTYGEPDTRPPERLTPYVDLSRALASPLDWRPPRALQAEPLPAPPRPGETTAAGAPPFPTRADVPATDWAAVASGRTTADYYLPLVDGKPLASRGSRSTVLTKVAGAVLVTLPAQPTPDGDDPVEALAARAWRVMARAVASDVTDDAPTLDDLWGVLVRFAARRADSERVDALVKASPLIVFTATGKYYIWNETTGGYMSPVGAVGIVHGIENYSPTMGAYTRTEGGAPRDTASLIAQYGQPARRVVISLGAERSWYDMDTGTLYEGTKAPLFGGPSGAPREAPRVTPRYHAQVDAWLRLLGGLGSGGSDPEDMGDDGPDSPGTSALLLDWLATLTRTDRPTCALYIHGKKGAGKGMLMAALAAVWGADACCSFTDAFGDFNEAITGCPVVHLDEGISDQAFRKMGMSSAEFRSSISERSRPIRRKHLPTAEGTGCPRYVITANNRRALPFNEQHTADDIDAIAERILYVRCADGTAAYLSGPCGGAEGTEDWVMSRRLLANGRPDPADPGRPGKIVEHLAWLEANREVVPGARFLVHGVPSDYHEDLAANNHSTRDVLAAVAHAFDRAQAIEGVYPDQDCRKARTKGGAVPSPLTVHVNVQGLHKNWSMLSGTQKPTESDITRVLMALARGPETRIDVGTGPANIGRKQRRAWPIPVGAVLRIAEQFQIGDRDDMVERMSAGGTWAPGAGRSPNAPPVTG